MWIKYFKDQPQQTIKTKVFGICKFLRVSQNKIYIQYKNKEIELDSQGRLVPEGESIL